MPDWKCVQEESLDETSLQAEKRFLREFKIRDLPMKTSTEKGLLEIRWKKKVHEKIEQ
jgi:hypothetical protein